MTAKKHEVPEWKQDATRLKVLFEQLSNKLTQEEFGKKYGIGTQSMVSHYLNGKAPRERPTSLPLAWAYPLQSSVRCCPVQWRTPIWSGCR